MAEQTNSEKPAEGSFLEDAVRQMTAAVLVYDLEDFTSFLQVPDIQHAATRYLNFIDQEVRKTYLGGKPIYEDEKEPLNPPVANPLHRKFLGDGAMLIFDVTKLELKTRAWTLRSLVLNTWNLKNSFDEINDRAREFMPTAKMPLRIRFGLTYGTVHELRRADTGFEYIGFPINLAARLQKYAGVASFLASARVDLPFKWFNDNGFRKVLPTKLRNADSEYLYIDQDDLKDSADGMFTLVSANAQPGQPVVESPKP